MAVADYWTPETVAHNRRYGTGLMQAGTDASPVGHWTQAIARALPGGVGGYLTGQANMAESEGNKRVADMYAQGLKGGNMKSIAAALMGDPFGREKGQQLAQQHMTTQASQGFQQAQQDRQFAQQKEMAGIQHRNQMALRQETDIVRNLRAAGIDPASPEGQQILRNSIKGGSPIDQALAGILQNAIPGAQPSQPAPSSIRPMSDAGQPDQPQIIQAQTATPGSPPQSPQNDPEVDTPLGRMPQSRARILGFALAMQGKGDAGKMMAGEPGLGKEATNDIDKKFANATEQYARLEGIMETFKPEYQTIGTRFGMSWTGLKAKIDPSKIDPKTRNDLIDYSKFRRRSFENINRLINELSGAATSVQEADRIKMQVPDTGQGILDGDDPITFEAKMKDVHKQTGLAMARHAWLKKNNPQLLSQLSQRGMQGIENVMPLERMSEMMNQRRNEIYQELKQRYPGSTPKQLLPFVGQQLNQEFGI